MIHGPINSRFTNFILCVMLCLKDQSCLRTERWNLLVKFSNSQRSADHKRHMGQNVNCDSYIMVDIQCVPLATKPGISLIILTPMKIVQ